jgi:hypothetical protein
MLHSMKSRILYLSIFLFSISALSLSQVSDSNLTTTEKKDSVADLLYAMHGVRIENPVKAGTGISGCFFLKDYPWIESYNISLALYTGHSFSFNKMIQGFAANSHLYNKYNEKPMYYKYSNTFIFYAPGISLFSMNRKYSLDLYKKLETQIYVNGKQQIAPVKINFHF